HSPKLFFQMLSNMKNKGKITSRNLIVNIIGNIENQKWQKNFYELNKLVAYYPYQPHKKCLEIMAKSNVLLLLATNMNSTEFLPAKMFEYFYLKKPIFAILSFRGELSSTLKEYGNSYIGYESEPYSIESSFNKLLSDWENNCLHKLVSDEFLSQFNREIQTKKLVTIFDEVLAENEK
ncbi:MAG: glycosyltransferase, partial [Calditrichales bacterium]|nr:glycosyltransferase [Calditrichales bacterium]